MCTWSNAASLFCVVTSWCMDVPAGLMGARWECTFRLDSLLHSSIYMYCSCSYPHDVVFYFFLIYLLSYLVNMQCLLGNLASILHFASVM